MAVNTEQERSDSIARDHYEVGTRGAPRKKSTFPI
jgi:hypothetical protein